MMTYRYQTRSARGALELASAMVFLAILLTGPLTAKAAVIASETFNTYALGELNTQNGGTGFGGAWTAVTGVTQIVDPGTALSYVVPGGGTVSGGNRALEISGNNSNAAFRALSAAQGDMYFSFLLRLDAGAVGNNDFGVWWFDNVTTGTHTANRPNIGLKGNGGDGSTTDDIMARLNLGSEAYVSGSNVGTGTDHLIVGHLFKSVAATFDKFEIWFDPSAGDALFPDATAIGGAATIATFLNLGLRSANLDSNDRLYLDELTMGTTFGDVVPLTADIPEPATLAIFGLGLAGFGFVRRRRRA